MKKKLKITSLNEKGVEKIEVEKLQSIKAGYVRGTCTAENEGSCTTEQSFHDKFSDW